MATATTTAPLTRNRDLFYRVADVIESSPESYEQAEWNSMFAEGFFPFSDRQWDEAKNHVCGTRACVAGWASILGTNDFIAGPKGSYVLSKPAIRDLGHDLDNPREHDYMAWKYQALRGKGVPERLARAIFTAHYDWHENGAAVLGLTDDEAELLFAGGGRPRGRRTVAQALREIGDGAPVHKVWRDVPIGDPIL